MRRTLQVYLLILIANLGIAAQNIAKLPFKTERFSLLDAPATPQTIARIGNLIVRAGYVDNSQNTAVFSFERGGETVYKLTLDDLYNPNGWFTISPDNRFFAITWSNGGAVGNFHTRLFERTASDRIVEESAVIDAVLKSFEEHHYCRTRGDNLTAVRWLSSNDLLLEASVYPTSDCGREMGYTSRYLLRVPEGKVERAVNIPIQ